MPGVISRRNENPVTFKIRWLFAENYDGSHKTNYRLELLLELRPPVRFLVGSVCLTLAEVPPYPDAPVCGDSQAMNVRLQSAKRHRD